jgi:nucleotide-binding universal stress UspA family protein
MDAGRIVVGVDGSDSSLDALRWAAAQARVTGAELVAVTAWSFPPTSYPVLAGYMPMPVTADLEKETRIALERLVRDTLGEVEVTLSVPEGHPAVVLIDAARGADLLVVGCRGHGGFVGALVGSISQHLVAHAPCPVVVFRHPKHAD